jgi:uncharacterized protein YqhQ
VATVYYGGQALIEGVMMRGRVRATAAVRDRSGAILTRREALPAALYRRRIARLPFVRGLVMLWEMLILGTRMMLFSARIQAALEPEAEVSRGLLGGMIAFSLAVTIGIFFVTPLFLARAGGHWVHGSLAANVLEGVVRLGLFIGYLLLLGRLRRMQRVFQYHGAEHKTVNAYEAGAELTPRSVQRFSLVHVRCGTSFLLWVVVLSIFVFALIGRPPLLIGVASRIVLVPFVAGLGYEILRLGARFHHVPVVRILIQPGFWLQGLTTREPSDDQVEVAIAALKDVLMADGAPLAAANELASGSADLVTVR